MSVGDGSIGLRRWDSAARSLLDRLSVRSSGVPPAFAFIVIAATCLAAGVIAVFYTTGDAAAYSALFGKLGEVGFGQIAFWQRCFTTSVEPIYAMLIWAGANIGLTRFAFVMVTNLVLIGLVAVWLWRNQAPWPTWLLLFSNFYLLMMFGTADRLKLAIIFLLGAGLVHVPWQRVGLVLLGIGSHIEGAMLCGAWLCGRIPGMMRSGSLRRHGPLLLVIIAVAIAAAALFVVFNWPIITRKMEYYSVRSRGWVEAVDVLLLLAVGLLAGSDRLRVVFTLVPVAVLSVPLSNARMTMLGFILLLQQLVEERRSGHPAFLVLMAYLSYKSIDFARAIAATGNGFWDLRVFAVPSLETCLRYFSF